SSDVCSSDLSRGGDREHRHQPVEPSGPLIDLGKSTHDVADQAHGIHHHHLAWPVAAVIDQIEAGHEDELRDSEKTCGMLKQHREIILVMGTQPIYLPRPVTKSHNSEGAFSPAQRPVKKGPSPSRHACAWSNAVTPCRQRIKAHEPTTLAAADTENSDFHVEIHRENATKGIVETGFQSPLNRQPLRLPVKQVTD